MSHTFSYPPNRRRYADHRATTPTRPSPLRYASTIPTTPDDEEPQSLDSSKPSTAILPAPSPTQRRISNQQPDRRRISLGELQQAPNSRQIQPPPATPKQETQTSEEMSVGISTANFRDAPSFGHHDPLFDATHGALGYTSLLESTDLEKLGRSATRELRTLSKLADQGTANDFTMTGLQRTLSKKVKKSGSVPGYGGRTWMDTERQYRQAYEYLCHIGEAKEWIEHVIGKPIPPIIQLEETLRDGVTLAEVVQAFRPQKKLRIFRHPRLQFRHSDNIVLFFHFLADVELPELFRFELVDLYEKKNIPKVIYCIHALSWLLLGKEMVDFRIGNLVGRLNFEHHELESTQKGLDKAGVSMPNFSGMGQRFGAEVEALPEPEPEPVETEDERVDRELADCANAVLDLQAQLRGALLRLRLANTMYTLYEEENGLTDLQARIRAAMTRQTTTYQLDRHRFAVSLQSQARGFIVRVRLENQRRTWKINEKNIIIVQSLFRGRAARNKAQAKKTSIQHYWRIHTLQVTLLQSLVRRKAAKKVVEAMKSERTAFWCAHKDDVIMIQSLARRRGALREMERVKAQRQAYWKGHEQKVTQVQNTVRQWIARRQLSNLKEQRKAYWDSHTGQVTVIQNVFRRNKAIKLAQITRASLVAHEHDFGEIQAAVRGALLRRHLTDQLDALEDAESDIVHLQSTIRGKLYRNKLHSQSAAMTLHECALIDLQSQMRAMLLRNSIGDQLDALQDCEDEVIDLQATIRGKLLRVRFDEKQRYYQENIKKIIKVQSFARMKQQGQAYKSLTMGKNPPVSTIKNFVHLLNDSDFDFSQELESEKVQQAVVQQIKKVEEVEDFIAEVDVKIGLLAHTKIHSDEIAKLKRQVNANFAGLTRKSASIREPGSSPSLNRESRAKIERYSELFFLLQTQPQYLARLFKKFRENGATEIEYKKLESLVMSTFAFAQKQREEFFLLKLLTRSVKEEIDTCSTLQDFARGNFFFSKLYTMYTRVPRDRKYIQQVLRPTIKTQIVENEKLDLESDPLQIYRGLLNDEQLRFGRSTRDPNLPREEAIRQEDVRREFVRHLQDIRDLIDHFLATLKERLQHVPFGTRHMVQQMFDLLRARFPHESPRHVLQIAGHWLWKSYFRPALTDPEAFGLMDSGLDEIHRNNIGTFAKVLNQMAMGKLFDHENVYLQPLNRYLEEFAIPELEAVWTGIIEVQDIESKFEIGQLDDFYAKTKPTLFIKTADMIAMHSLFATEVPFICTAPEDDILREVVRELGNPKANEAEILLGPPEMTLTLATKMHGLEDSEAKNKTLLIQTKRCVLYIIRVQTGASLLEIMVKPITEDDRARWAAIVHDELQLDSSKQHHAYADSSTTLADIASLGYEELKRTALENIIALEAQGHLSRSNQYQDLLNDIAIDIRNKHRRRLQRSRELDTARANSRHLEDKRAYLEDRLKAYNAALHQSLTMLQEKSKDAALRRFVVPFSKQWAHQRELARAGKAPTFGSWRRSAEHLAAKGVLLSWTGHDLRQDDLTVSSDAVNEFVVEGSRGTMMIPGAVAKFTWDDLLVAEYEGREVVEFFGKQQSGANDAVPMLQGIRGGVGFGGEAGLLRLDRRGLMLWLSKKFLGPG